ncbi:MAG: hypothetical protein HFE73_09010 [Firmicutes bacterium]|nr:hypothetical protein [Bacillota bacterium]
MEDKRFIQAKEIYETIEAPEELREKVLARVEQAAGIEEAERKAQKLQWGRASRRFSRKMVYGGSLMAACFAVFIMVWSMSGQQMPESIWELGAKAGLETEQSTYDEHRASEQDDFSEQESDTDIDPVGGTDNRNVSAEAAANEPVVLSSDETLGQSEHFIASEDQTVYGLDMKKDHDQPLKPQSRQTDDDNQQVQAVSHENDGGHDERNGIQHLRMSEWRRWPLSEKNDII